MIELILRRSIIIRTVRHLKRDPMVASVKRHHNKITIRFKTGIIESWYLKEGRLLLPDDPFKGSELNVNRQYTYSNIEDDAAIKKRLMILRYRDYKRASFIERRLGIQRLIAKIIGMKMPVQYTDNTLYKDLANITECGVKPFIRQIKLYAYSRSQPGRLLVESLTPFTLIMRSAFKDPHRLYPVIKAILKRKRDITVNNITRFINKGVPSQYIKLGRLFISPNFYRSILQFFKIKDQVIYDPLTDIGHKFIASTIEGCHYYVSNAGDLEKLAEFIGGDVNYPCLDRYDVIFADYDLRCSTQVQDIQHYLDIADYVVIYVPDSIKSQMPKPHSMVQIMLLHKKAPDYFFYYASI